MAPPIQRNLKILDVQRQWSIIIVWLRSISDALLQDNVYHFFHGLRCGDLRAL